MHDCVKYQIRIAEFLGFIFNVLVLNGCNPESKPIAYGEDKCEFCRMSIVDRRFGGEIVTAKGKVFKFDAVECTINYLDEHVEDELKLNLILTNTYDSPGKLVNAKECYYLKSTNMPSPMGMFLNPFENSSEAKRFQKENTGTMYNWQELRAEFQAFR